MFSFVETKLFTRLVGEWLTETEYQELQTHLIGTPEAGLVVPGSGGVRKLRWRTTSQGKRGGLRVVYFLRLEHDEIFLLTLYPKNVRDDIPAKVLRKIREEAENG